MRQLIFWHGEEDVSNSIELRNGKANPFGWSQYEIWRTDVEAPGLDIRIGWLESGYLSLIEGYRCEERQEEIQDEKYAAMGRLTQ